MKFDDVNRIYKMTAEEFQVRSKNHLFLLLSLLLLLSVFCSPYSTNTASSLLSPPPSSLFPPLSSSLLLLLLQFLMDLYGFLGNITVCPQLFALN